VNSSLRWLVAGWLLLSLSVPAWAQGFKFPLPFTKKEPEQVRRTIGDEPPAQRRSGFELPKLSMPKLPAPKMSLPKLSLPKLPTPKLPSFGLGGAKKTSPRRPRGRMTYRQPPSTLEKFNQGTKDLFSKTKDVIVAPWTGDKTPARMSSARSKPKSSFFTLPWSQPEEPPQPRSVKEFLSQPRPGFDD
jgi:hypothetical protein